ncbi:MAG: hypothetical protein PVI74_16085, partial [Syntrophobacterales bacterium]
ILPEIDGAKPKKSGCCVYNLFVAYGSTLYGYEFDHRAVLQHAMWCWTPTRSKAQTLRLGSKRGSEC